MNERALGIVLAMTAILAIVGCSGQSGSASKTVAAKHNEHEHDHPSVGPHQGQLIELGQEEYHAELLHDDATHTVTIYLLDSKAKAAVPVDAKQLFLNLVVGGKPQQFTLLGKPLPTDPTRKCSCFTTTEEAVCEALDEKGMTGRLNVEIQGKSFTGKIEHHDHKHGEHKK